MIQLDQYSSEEYTKAGRNRWSESSVTMVEMKKPHGREVKKEIN